MKTLLVMRHAKSSWKDPSLEDFDRPLNKRGKRAAPFMATFLKEQQLLPEFVCCSAAKRTRGTVKRLFREWPEPVKVSYHEELYHAESEVIAEVLQTVPNHLTTIMVVGHNPGLEMFIDELCGVDVRFPTAAVAEIALDLAKWGEFKLVPFGELKNLWLPRELMGESAPLS